MNEQKALLKNLHETLGELKNYFHESLLEITDPEIVLKTVYYMDSNNLLSIEERTETRDLLFDHYSKLIISKQKTAPEIENGGGKKNEN